MRRRPIRPLPLTPGCPTNIAYRLRHRSCLYGPFSMFRAWQACFARPAWRRKSRCAGCTPHWPETARHAVSECLFACVTSFCLLSKPFDSGLFEKFGYRRMLCATPARRAWGPARPSRTLARDIDGQFHRAGELDADAWELNGDAGGQNEGAAELDGDAGDENGIATTNMVPRHSQSKARRRSSISRPPK